MENKDNPLSTLGNLGGFEQGMSGIVIFGLDPKSQEREVNILQGFQCPMDSRFRGNDRVGVVSNIHTIFLPFGVPPNTPLSSSGLTRRSRKHKDFIYPGFMRYAYPPTLFGAACRRCLRLPPPLPRECVNKKLPVVSFYASPFTLLKTRTTLCLPSEI